MKTALLIFLIIWLAPIVVFLIVHFHNFRKAFAKARWWTVIWFVGIFGILTEWIMFFFAWFTRKIPVIKWVFWIWMDDSRIETVSGEKMYAPDYHMYLGGQKETLWKAYAWHMRNRVWNLDSLFRPRKGERKIVETVVDELTMNGYIINQEAVGNFCPMARLKYWNDGIQGSNVNKGAFISKKFSIFGKGYVWEKIGDRLTFRYSVLTSFLGRWLLFISGENDKRNVFSLKWKRKLKIK